MAPPSARSARTPAALLAGWTLFVLGNRLNNLRTDDTEGGALALSLVLSGVSVVLAVLVLAGWWVGRSADRPAPGWRRAVQVLCGWTVAVWILRGVDIVLDWRSPAFVAVHLVLAAVSIGLAAWAWRAIVGERRAPGGAPVAPTAVER